MSNFIHHNWYEIKQSRKVQRHVGRPIQIRHYDRLTKNDQGAYDCDARGLVNLFLLRDEVKRKHEALPAPRTSP